MLDERFWTKVRRGSDGECWEWTAYKNPKGYGRFSLNGRPGFAHRFAYKEAKGPIPSDLCVLHRCDNPACVNPDHLWLGTKADNNQDMFKKGRGKSNAPKGEANTQATHTASQVTAIQADYLAGRSVADICAAYGVKRTFVHDVTSRSWKHIAADVEALKAERKRRMKSGAKVTAEIAIEIRNRLASGETGIALAAAYGIHKATISDIKLRKIWADVV
jgi:hypothetical protein